MTRSLRARVRLFVSPLEDRVTPTAGALDRGFATNGVATIAALKSVVDIAPTADGGAIVLGVIAEGSGSGSDPTADFGLVRLTAAGVIDTSFGVAGLATVGFNLQTTGDGPDVPAHVSVRPDGGIVATGTARVIGSGSNPGDSQIAVAVLTPTGVLDTGFDGDGKLTFKWIADQQNVGPVEMVALADNTFLVGGTVTTPSRFSPPSTPAQLLIASARLTPTGAFDSTYDGDGKAFNVIREDPSFISFGSESIGVAADGAIAVAYAEGSGEFAPLFGLRVNPDGSRDATFGPAGTANLGNTGVQFSSRLVRPTPDGKVVLVANSDSSSPAKTTVTRFLSTGLIDPGYGTAGKFTVTKPPFSTGPQPPYIDPSQAVVLSDGRVILAGSSGASLLRLSAAGVPDATFNADGYVVPNTSSSTDDFPNSARVIRPTAAGDRLYLVPLFSSGTSPTVLRTLADDSQNTPPTLGTVPDSTTLASAGFGLGTFFAPVGDAETPNSLTVTATSSDQTVVANAGISASVNAGKVQLNITPVTGVVGSTTITLTVTDGAGATATTTFVVNRVAAGGNTSPRLNALTDRSVAVGTPVELLVLPSDTETATSGLLVTATSSAPAVATVGLVDMANYRLLTVTPAAGASAGQTTTVRVTVTDGGGLVTFSEFTVTIGTPAVNLPPVIGAIGAQAATAGTFTTVAFTASDPDGGSFPTLRSAASSSNPAVVPNAGLFAITSSFSGNSVQFTPASAGTAVITLVVADAQGAISTRTFDVTVGGGTGTNTAPTITAVGNQSVPPGTASTLAFTVGDAQTPAGSLTVVASSSNTAVVAASGLVLSNSGAGRDLTVTPVAGAVGVATITLTVTDAGGLTATTLFTYTTTTVAPPVGNPTISVVSDKTATAGVAVAPIGFTVGDDVTPAASLVVAAVSSNALLLPPTGVVLGGTGADRTVTLTPAAGQTGTATITLTVTDAGGLTATRAFTVTVSPAPVNTAPTISPLGNPTTTVGTAFAPLAVTVGDAQTPAGALTVTAASGNPALVPAAGVVVTGTGAARTITVTPAAGQTGTATITLTVTDAGGLTATTSFTVTVTPVVVPPPANTAPTIAAVADQTTTVGTAFASQTVTVGDTETAAAALTVTVASDNLDLVPLAGVVVTGTGATRTVTVTPAAGQTGTAAITLTVTDADGLTAITEYTVTVDPAVVIPPPNTPPTITAVANPTTTVGTAVAPLAVTVGDAQTPAAALTVTAASGNPALVPAAGVVVTGTGAARTVTVTPVAGQTGTAAITLTVTDSGGLTATRTFTVTVNPARPKVALVGVSDTVIGGTDGTFRVVAADHKVGAAVTAFPGFTGSVRVASADFNADGVSDTVVGTGPGSASHVRVIDGKTGAELFALDPFEAGFTGGVYVSAGDITGDGVPDLIVTPDEGGGPRVRAFTGKGFAQVADFFGIDDTNFRGGARTAVGDIDGDGVADLVVAAGFGGGPRVAAFDGKSGDGTGFTRKLFGDFFAFESDLRNGVFPAVGDVNGDGKADVVTGAGPGGGPRVSAFAGSDLMATPSVQTRLTDFFAGDPARRDGVRVAVKNLDADAKADVVAAVGPTVLAYSGKGLTAGTSVADLSADLVPGLTGGVFVG